MFNLFGRNAWSNGPPMPNGPGIGSGPGVARVVPGAGGGASGQVDVSRSDAINQAHRDAKALMYQRRKREENRSNYQESLKRDVVKEKNYLIFQFREGVSSVSFDEIGKVLDDLELSATDVVSIAGNPYNSNEIEILLKDESNIEISTLSKKLDDIGAPVTVNKMGKLEEVLIIRNLPLTLNQNMVKKWILESISPFVEEVHDIIPLKHSKRQLTNVGDRASKFFEGKYDGNWRVSVTPKGSAEVPSFAAFGPENLQGTVKYSKRVQSVNELCWSCYSPGHKRSDKDVDGKFLCSGPKEWRVYVKEFQEKAVAISGKSAEDLFEFSAEGPIVARLEKELSDTVEKFEKANKEKEDRESALKQAQEEVKEALDARDKHWQSIVNRAVKKNEEQEKAYKEKLESMQTADFHQIKEDMEQMKIQLSESRKQNDDLKEEVVEMKKENEKLQAQSVKDAMDIADISSTNDSLISMVTRRTTLDEVEESTDGSVIQVQENLEVNNEVFDDKIESGTGKKHSLSPASLDSGLPEGKQLIRTKSIEKSVIKSIAALENPPPTFNHPPPPPPPETAPIKPAPAPPTFNHPPPPPPPEETAPIKPPPAPKKSPPTSIFRPVGKGTMVEIFDETSGNIIGHIISCQVKRSHKDYQMYKDHWNVKITKGNDVYKAGTEAGFDLSNQKSYKVVLGPSQQSSISGPRQRVTSLNSKS